MTVRAPVGEVNIADTEYCIGRGVAALRSPHPAYAEQLVRSLRDRWAAEEAGTVFPAVNKSQVLTLPVIAPPDDEVDAFERDARPFYDVVAGAHAQVARLEALRDLLLPQLLDGRLKVTSDDAGRVEAS